MRQHSSRSGRVSSALGIAAGVILMAAACTSGAGPGTTTTSAPPPAPKVPKVTAAQIASAVKTPGETVPVGGWAQVYVSAGNGGGTAETYLVRVASVVKGAPGEFKNVHLMGGTGGPSLKTAVPYFIAVQVAVVKGNPMVASSPGSETVADAGKDEHVAVLQEVTKLHTHCNPAPATGDLASAEGRTLDAIMNRCTIAISDPGPQYAPTVLDIGALDSPTVPAGTPAASLALPSPSPAG